MAEETALTSFAKRLKEARLAADLNQDGLAEQFEISREAVSQWETGKSVPEFEKLARLSEILGCSLDWLISGIGPMRLGRNRSMQQDVLDVINKYNELGDRLRQEILSD